MPLQLPMGKTHTQVGTKSADQLCHFRQALYPIMDKEYLTSSFCFKIDGITDKIFLKYLYLCLDRLPVRRRCIHDTEIAGTHQTELQGSGDRRFRECQTIYIGPKGFDLFQIGR